MGSARKLDNCLSQLGRVKTAVTQTTGSFWQFPFAAAIFLHPTQRPSLRGLDGEFWPAGELSPSASCGYWLEISEKSIGFSRINNEPVCPIYFAPSEIQHPVCRGADPKE
jgi:hypothetical protein